MECYCYLRIQDPLSDGKTHHERRFGIPFDEPVIPFGAMDEYHPISATDHQDYINLVINFCQVCSLDMRYTRVESGKETK